jgi:hypothetical protein
MGKVVQPLQSINYHDSHAHGHERHEPFTWLVGLVLLGFSLVVWFVSCSRCETCVQGSWFGYRWDAYECWLILATGVTHVSLWPLITVGNLGVSSCLDVV